MKKILLALLFVGTTVSAQSLIGFGSKEYGTFSVFVDPGGSIEEGGLDFGADLELVSKWGYVKAGVQMFPTIKYFDMAGTAGLNFVTNPFETFRFYTGLRLGFINRWESVENTSETYPLAGWEAGVDYNINDKWYVGASLIYDWREDFEFSGAEAEFQGSGRVKVGYKFDVK